MSHPATLRGVCPNCGGMVRAATAEAGRLVRCQKCGTPVSLPAAPDHPLPPARPPRSPLVLTGLAAVAVPAVIAAGVWVVARGSLSDRSDRAKAEALRAEWAVLQKEQGDDQEYRKRIDEG